MFLVKVISAVLLVYLFCCLVIVFFQGRLMFFPTKKIDVFPSDYGMVYEEVELITKDKASLYAWWIPHESSKGAVIVCHGNAGNISHRLILAKAFKDLGLSVLLFDYRGYGRSGGKPTEKGTYRDAEAAYDFVINEKEVKPSLLLLYGMSMGSAVAVEVATKKRFAAIILEGAFTSAVGVGQEMYPILPMKLILHYKYNSISKINRIKVPILFIHTKDDEVVSFAQGKRLFDAYHGKKEFMETRGGHNNASFLIDEEKVGRVKKFIETNLFN